MESVLTEYGIYGLAIGAFTFLIIGLFHPLVIKAEYYWGTKSWWCFLLAGILCIFLSVWIKSIFFSAVFGVIAFSAFWSIFEIFEQEKRVEKGWFPHNPKRKKKSTDFDVK